MVGRYLSYPVWYDFHQKMKIMNTQTINQLELDLENAAEPGKGGRACPSFERRLQRQRRARYWFDRMRQVVDCARDWPAAPAPRRKSAASQAKSDEHHLAE